MKLRSFNPVLRPHFAAHPKPTHQYGFKNIASPEVCQLVLDKLRLTDKYPNSNGNLDIIDVFSGHGMLSTMINYELKPRNHIVLDDTKDNQKVWESRIEFLESTTGNRERFKYFPFDGFAWSSYDKLLKEMKVLTPIYKARNKVHDELLIVGNLTSNKTGESLFAQWIHCGACQNWLQKYGRIRMVLLVREATSSKFLSGTGFVKRNRAALKRDLYTESRLVAISDSQMSNIGLPGESFDPNILVKDQPLILPSSSVLPAGGDLSVVEVVPRDLLDDIDINAVDYLSQVLMYRANMPVAYSLSTIAPGAAEDLGPQIPPEILDKKTRCLTRDDFLKILEVYSKWAFKPSDEETINFFTDETRNF